MKQAPNEKIGIKLWQRIPAQLLLSVLIFLSGSKKAFGILYPTSPNSLTPRIETFRINSSFIFITILSGFIFANLFFLGISSYKKALRLFAENKNMEEKNKNLGLSFIFIIIAVSVCFLYFEYASNTASYTTYIE